MFYQGAGDVMGGLAQAFACRPGTTSIMASVWYNATEPFAALRLPARAFLQLRAAMSTKRFDELFRTLQQMETDIVGGLGKIRSEHCGDGA